MHGRALFVMTTLSMYRQRIQAPINLFARLTAVCVIAGTVGGCAAQLAYREGRDLIAQDKVEEGLAKFQDASAREPTNAEYRAAYLQTRDRAVETYLRQADRLAATASHIDAEKSYRRVLSIDPANERAMAGFKVLDMEARHVQIMRQALVAMDKKDVALARQKLLAILAENPRSEPALELQRKLGEMTASAPAESQLAAAYRKPITIEFKDVALKQVFEVISRTSGLNFLFDKEVKTDQKTSIFLKNSTIESAVHFTLLTNQLEQQVLDANTILIYPNTAAKIKDYQEMVIKSFFLTNAEAKTVANTLKTILKSRDIVIDEKLNMLIVRDSPEAIRLADKLVALHDVPEPEVMLEVEILEVKRTRFLELGIRWPSSLSLTPLPMGSLGLASGTDAVGAAVSGSGLTLRDLRRQDSGSLGLAISPVTVNARKQDSDANLLANPRIRARNHEKAKILIGERVPNITTTATSTGFVSESINYVDVGLTLNVEPTIYLDNDVAIKVSLEVSNIVSQLKTQSGSVAYQIGTRTASTVLRLKDGETQVLAGLINDEDRRTGNKVPGMGELPILGRLFGSSADDNQKTEIVLSITPHLIRNIKRPEAALAEFKSGTEGMLRSRPDVIASGPSTSTTDVAANHVARPAPSTPAVAPPPVTPSSNAAIGSGVSSAASPVIFAGAVGNVPIVLNGNARSDWQGPSQAKVGDTFTVQLMLQSDQPLTSIPLAIGFDNKALQVTNIAEGVFLKQGGAQTTFTSRVDPNGQILMTGTRTSSGGAANLAGFATITFRALSAGDASLVKLVTIAPIGLSGRLVTATPSAPFLVKIAP